MPSGPELLLIVVIVAVIAALVTLAFAIGGSIGGRSAAGANVSTIGLAPGTGRDWLAATAGDLDELRSHHVEWLSSDTVIVTWRHRPGWVYLVAIFAFPIGLVALTWTVEERGTITLVDGSSEQSRVCVGGDFSRAAVAAVNARVPEATVPTMP